MYFEKTFANGWTDRFEVLDVAPVPYTEDWILGSGDQIHLSAFAEVGQAWCDWRIKCFEEVATLWGKEFIYVVCEHTVIFRPNQPAVAFEL